jgi:hypothetical protein
LRIDDLRLRIGEWEQEIEDWRLKIDDGGRRTGDGKLRIDDWRLKIDDGGRFEGWGGENSNGRSCSSTI